MRLAAQVKGGFYPAPPAAVSMALRVIRPPGEGKTCILDPCCGKGEALRQLAVGLGAQAFGIELDGDRSEIAKATLEEIGGTFVGPASFFGTSLYPQAGTFGMVWLNPPFDDEIGGGQRVEHGFLIRATAWLKTGGLMCLVCPENVADRYELQLFLNEWYEEDLFVMPFPEGYRRFKEVIVFGRKKAKAERHPWVRFEQQQGKILAQPFVLPAAYPPRRFEKSDFTEQELSIELERSPLRRILSEPEMVPLPRPPLPLATGHIALLLAAGHLDGIVRPAGEAPHVVRGTAKKEKYLASTEETEDSAGRIITKSVYSEKIIMTVRTATADGRLHTFDQE